jgi:hypothetical protein
MSNALDEVFNSGLTALPYVLTITGMTERPGVQPEIQFATGVMSRAKEWDGKTVDGIPVGKLSTYYSDDKLALWEVEGFKLSTTSMKGGQNPAFTELTLKRTASGSQFEVWSGKSVLIGYVFTADASIRTFPGSRKKVAVFSAWALWGAADLVVTLAQD